MEGRRQKEVGVLFVCVCGKCLYIVERTPNLDLNKAL